MHAWSLGPGHTLTMFHGRAFGMLPPACCARVRLTSSWRSGRFISPSSCCLRSSSVSLTGPPTRPVIMCSNSSMATICGSLGQTKPLVPIHACCFLWCHCITPRSKTNTGLQVWKNEAKADLNPKTIQQIAWKSAGSNSILLLWVGCHV